MSVNKRSAYPDSVALASARPVALPDTCRRRMVVVVTDKVPLVAASDMASPDLVVLQCRRKSSA